MCPPFLHYKKGIAAGLWFSPGTPVFSTNKTDCHDIFKYWGHMFFCQKQPLIIYEALVNSYYFV